MSLTPAEREEMLRQWTAGWVTEEMTELLDSLGPAAELDACMDAIGILIMHISLFPSDQVDDTSQTHRESQLTRKRKVDTIWMRVLDYMRMEMRPEDFNDNGTPQPALVAEALTVLCGRMGTQGRKARFFISSIRAVYARAKEARRWDFRSWW